MESTAPAELLSRAAAHDAAAWQDIVDRYANLLWSVARAHRLSDSDSAEVVQTTWLRLLENLGRIREPERLASWLATTARRECLRTLRLRGRVVLLAEDGVLDDVDAGGDPLDAAMITEERDATLWQAFSRLSGRCRSLLRLLMASPAPSYQEVSDALGLPVGSIGPTRGRCLGHLRTLLATDGVTHASGDIDDSSERSPS